MLVVTANWGIGDGSLGAGPGAGRAAAFVSALRHAAARAGCRRDGGYRPVERVDVVFAGDTFDWLVSRRWNARRRPWDSGRGTLGVRTEVARASLARAWPLFGDLRRLVRHGLRVPAADRQGRPSLERIVTVPVALVLLAGDRDAWLEHAGGVRLARRLGVRIGSGTGVGGVVIHHGHDAGPPDRSRSAAASGAVGDSADGGPTLLESTLVDLVVPFAMLPTTTEHAGLVRRLAAVESPLDMPALVAAECGLATTQRTERGLLLADDWRRAVDDWRRVAARCMPRSNAPFDPLDALAGWLSQIDPLPQREPPALLTAVSAPPDPRAFAATSTLTVLGHPAGRHLPSGVPCLCLGPRPAAPGARVGAATTVGGPGASWVVPESAVVEPIRAVVLGDPPGIGSVTALAGFDERCAAAGATAGRFRAIDAA
ncbi:MAG: hypothetical protein ACOYK7_10725 [Pirellulales bacterium]